MKAYFQHLQWVIQAQERITTAENKVQVRDQRIEELRQEVVHLQELLNFSHVEKRQLQEQHNARLGAVHLAYPETQDL